MLYIIVIAVFQAFILSFLLMLKKQKSFPEYILASYFLLSGSTALLAYLEIYNRLNGYPYSFLINISTPFIYLHGPVLWFYTSSLTSNHFRVKPLYLLHFLPFLVVLTYFSFSLYSLPAEEKINFDKTESFKNTLMYPMALTTIAVSNIGYLVWCLLVLKKYRRKIKSYFSKIENIDLRWLSFLLWSAIVFYSGISLLYILDALLNLFKFGTLQIVGFSYASILILLLGVFGIRQGNIFSSSLIEFDLDNASRIKFNNDKLAHEEQTFINQLLDFMKKNKPYTDSELTLAKLSAQLNVSPEYLSNILNSRLNMNYFDFVNHHRIEEFKKLCKDPQSQKLSLLGIAFNCGFNSKATFNRVFKKTTGLTPGEYLQKVSF